MVKDDGAAKPILFVVLCTIITGQYFYFTMPLSFLANELITNRSYSTIVTGTILGALSLSLAAGALTSNWLSQWLSPRQILILTLLILTLSTPITFASFERDAFAVIIFTTRLMQGFVIGICEPQIMSVMTSLYPERLGFVTGSFELAVSISSTLGPFVGGMVYEHLGFPIAYNFPNVLNFPACVVGLFFMRSTAHRVPLSLSEEGEEQGGRAPVHAMFILPIIAMGMITETLISMIVNTIESFYPNFFLEMFNRQEGYIGTVMAIAGVVYCVGTVVAGYLGDLKVPRKAMIFGGMGLIVMGTIFIDPTFLEITDKWAAFMLCVINLGSGLSQISILPCLILQFQFRAGVSREESSCQMSGLYRAAYFTGAFFGPIIGGALIGKLGYQICYTTLAATMGLNLVVLWAIELFRPHTVDVPLDKVQSYENILSNVEAR